MSERSLQERNEYIRQEAAFVPGVLRESGRVIVGQKNLLRKMLIALLCNGHILIEGVPGLAKTLAVRTLANCISADFQRIQFTPDLLPSDIVGTYIYNPMTAEFRFRAGPIFSNLVLADEINRAPAKVQSALLEAMEERQVTSGDESFALDKPFMVLATQNPVEQEGTYPLPEAQLDRFMLKVLIDYPSRKEEREVMKRMSGVRPDPPQAIIESDVIIRAQDVIHEVYVDEKIEEYVLDMIFATRYPGKHGFKKLETLIEVGASPRATIFLIKAARAHAFIKGRGYVTPDDVKAIAHEVLRHRILLSFEAQAEAVTTEQIIDHILAKTEVP